MKNLSKATLKPRYCERSLCGALGVGLRGDVNIRQIKKMDIYPLEMFSRCLLLHRVSHTTCPLLINQELHGIKNVYDLPY